MLQCEIKGGIPSHWDQSFIDAGPPFVSISWPPHTYQNLRQQNRAGTVGQSKPRSSTAEQVDEKVSRRGRSYVNIPMALDALTVPQSVISVRADRSPMSNRAHAADNAGTSTVAQLALFRLQLSGFYYGQITPTDARRLLEPYPAGTFLVRSSSDERYLFSLTVQILTAAGRKSTSVRIELLDTGEFRLDADSQDTHLLPSSPCVLDLLRRHMVDRGTGRGSFVFLNRAGNGCEIPMVLRRPLYRDPQPATLKHQCRRRIHATLNGRSVDRLCLLPSLKDYLKEYPSDL